MAQVLGALNPHMRVGLSSEFLGFGLVYTWPLQPYEGMSQDVENLFLCFSSLSATLSFT